MVRLPRGVILICGVSCISLVMAAGAGLLGHLGQPEGVLTLPVYVASQG